MDVHKIVIIGAGFAGLRTALELEKRCARMKSCEILLIDRRAEHLYTPLLYEVSSGELQASNRSCSGDLKSGVCVRFDAYVNIVKKKHIRFRRAEVTGIDREEQVVLLSGGERISYNDLVIAMGVEVATFGIPGVAEYALPMKTLSDAFAIRDRLHGFVQGYIDGKEKHLSIIVVGGGATGVEFAAESANFFARLASTGVLKSADYSVTLLEAAQNILPVFSESVRAVALHRLKELGVTIQVQTKLDEVKKGRVFVTGKLGMPSEYPSDVAVWTAGVKPMAAGKAWGLPTDERGSIQIERSFVVVGEKHIFALGDCVMFKHPKTKTPVPALAQVAVREAGVVAENIVRQLERKLPVTWSPPERWAVVVPMGGKYAIADFGKFHLSGTLGFFVRKIADLFYFLSILPPLEAWKFWRQGADVYAKND